MTAPVTTTTSLPLHIPAALRLLPSPPRLQPVARLGLGRRRALLRCAAVSELAPAASATYGAFLLGGGAFAYARSGSKGSIFGGLSGSALMGVDCDSCGLVDKPYGIRHGCHGVAKASPRRPGGAEQTPRSLASPWPSPTASPRRPAGPRLII